LHSGSRHTVIRSEDNALLLEKVLKATTRLEGNRLVVALDAQDGALTYAGELGQFSLTDVERDPSRKGPGLRPLFDSRNKGFPTTGRQR
jgi:hypothetical protein